MNNKNTNYEFNEKLKSDYEKWNDNIILSYNTTNEAIEILLEKVGYKEIKRRPIIILIRTNIECIIHILLHYLFEKDYYIFLLFRQLNNKKYFNKFKKTSDKKIEYLNKFKEIDNHFKEYLSFFEENLFLENYIKKYFNDIFQKEKNYRNVIESILGKKIIPFNYTFKLFNKYKFNETNENIKEAFNELLNLYRQVSSYIHLENKGFSISESLKSKNIIEKYNNQIKIKDYIKQFKNK